MTDNDRQQIIEHGLTVDEVEKQLVNFITGFPFANLIAPATKENGIKVLSLDEEEAYIHYYIDNSPKHSILKFVPASGAATRMFKDLFSFAGEYMGLKYTLKNYPEVKKTIDNLDKFAFYKDLKQAFVANKTTLEEYLTSEDYATVVSYILGEIGLGYGRKPKALILFHSYENEERQARFAIEEHFVEAVFYAKENGDNINIHFTLSAEHLDEVKNTVERIKPYYEKKFGVHYNVNYSLQKPSTDTVAVDDNGELVHDKAGNILFRPSGHGALIENLNDCKGDIIFIKNIDNVAHDKVKSSTYKYKQILGGVLLKIQDKAFSALRILDKQCVSKDELQSVCALCEELGIFLSDAEKEDKQVLQQLLNRPIRVCGMVKNEGEKGGGPFWVERNGKKSLQIVESAQINLDNEEQKSIFNNSTHFNPVDLVCGVKNYKGDNFDLRSFVDQKSGFISQKSYDGISIQAQEKAGLWNGAMADWITIFVQVPLLTFTPVKTVNDLLRKEHQE